MSAGKECASSTSDAIFKNFVDQYHAHSELDKKKMIEKFADRSVVETAAACIVYAGFSFTDCNRAMVSAILKAMMSDLPAHIKHYVVAQICCTMKPEHDIVHAVLNFRPPEGAIIYREAT